INVPERRVTGAGEVAPLVTVDQDAVVITAVKLADDGSGDVVVRFHEAHGGRARATLTIGFPATGVQVTDLLERPLADTEPPALDGDRITVRLRPFQLMTLRLKRA
ncbi:glycosyl hydrolase-related protein, partial [Streptomyces viridiviolaceus]